MRVAELTDSRQLHLLSDSSFAAFLRDSDSFFPGEDPQSKTVDGVAADSWKLDSVTVALLNMWKNPHSGVSPAGQDLSGITFFTIDQTDFSGVDFSKAVMNVDTLFYGRCNVLGATFPEGEPRSDHDRCDK